MKLNEQAFAEFDEHRNSSAKLKKGWSELAKKKARNLLQKYSEEDQQAMVDYSIIGGYTGLYPIKKTVVHEVQRAQAHKPFSEDIRTRPEDKARAEADLKRLEAMIARRH